MNVTLHEGPDSYTIPGVRTLNRVKDPAQKPVKTSKNVKLLTEDFGRKIYVKKMQLLTWVRLARNGFREFALSSNQARGCNA